jgi:hypothetical protein
MLDLKFKKMKNTKANIPYKRRLKQIVIMILLLFHNQLLFAQLTEIKKKTFDLFWYLPINIEKFDIRSKIHGNDNFSDIHENSNEPSIDANPSIKANFESNKILNNLGFDNNMVVYFNKNGFPTQWGIISIYPPDEINKCQEQIAEVYNYFKIDSFKSTAVSISIENKLIGRGYLFFSSQTMLTQKKPYITLQYTYNISVGRYYFNIIYYPDALK